MMTQHRTAVEFRPGSAPRAAGRSIRRRRCGQGGLADERQRLVIEHGLDGKPCGRRVEAVLRYEVGAVGQDGVDALLELEPLVVVLVPQPHAGADDLQHVDDDERPVALMGAELAMVGVVNRDQRVDFRVARGLDTLPPASEAERRVLRRVGAPPDVRLACQLRPAHSAEVVPLLAARDPLAALLGHERQGVEQEIAVVFADLRGFTRMAEKRLPYDVVYLLNRYFEAVGSAIERTGGIANQFTGDGVMALFGVESGPEPGCRQALAAARAMIAGVDALSRELGGELPEPLRLGIGIHVGHAVVGRMGYGDSTYFTAVGDTVHVAARLEQATKDYNCELVVSEDVVARAGVDFGAFPRHEVALRNRATPVLVRVIERVASLPAASVPGGAP